MTDFVQKCRNIPFLHYYRLVYEPVSGLRSETIPVIGKNKIKFQLALKKKKVSKSVQLTTRLFYGFLSNTHKIMTNVFYKNDKNNKVHMKNKEQLSVKLVSE